MSNRITFPIINIAEFLYKGWVVTIWYDWILVERYSFNTKNEAIEFAMLKKLEQ